MYWIESISEYVQVRIRDTTYRQQTEVEESHSYPGLLCQAGHSLPTDCSRRASRQALPAFAQSLLSSFYLEV